MEKGEIVTVKAAVQKLQLYLLDGIQDEYKLFAAGAVMSQSDYHDVVIERSISNVCGYPLCGNTLPSERPRKGRYRISLKEHKVYDLQETYMYCSTNCVVNSQAFVASLEEERSSDLNPAKLNEVLRLFSGRGLDDTREGQKKDKKSVFSDLRVQEKSDVKGGDVSMEEWIGPSNAIEGYVPKRDNTISKEQQPKSLEKGQKAKKSHKQNKGKNVVFNEMDFTSAIIMQDEYIVSKSLDQTVTIGNLKNNEGKSKLKSDHREGKSTELGESAVSKSSHDHKKCLVSDGSQGRNVTFEKLDDLSKELDEKLSISNPPAPCKKVAKPDSKTYIEKGSASNGSVLKSSLKSSTTKKGTRSITWADDKTGSQDNKNLCDYNEYKNNRDVSIISVSGVTEVDDNSYRLASAEACAEALTEAAEAVATGESDVRDAVIDAGLIILPPPHELDGVETLQQGDMLDIEQAPLKWPSKPGFPDSDIFSSDDSWFDSPPDGFSLTLSPFSTMFTTLFAWTSSSSLAYIYGHDETFHEEYLSVNGREYPRKAVATDGRSPEIRQALAGCLARALPGLVADLRLPTPLSTLEREMGHLLDTMSFMDPIPALRMKQWQLLVLLLLEALSVCRVPALAPYMTGRRVWLPKVLEGAKISAEEYEILKDLIIPLGRVPQFVMQSGG